MLYCCILSVPFVCVKDCGKARDMCAGKKFFLFFHLIFLIPLIWQSTFKCYNEQNGIGCYNIMQ